MHTDRKEPCIQRHRSSHLKSVETVEEVSTASVLGDGNVLHRLKVYAAIDNYRVRGAVFTDEVPELVDATKIAARIASRCDQVEVAVVSLLMAIYQLSYVPDVPRGYQPFNDEELEEFFI